MADKYVLDAGGNPQLELDVLTWARWFETAERHVGLTTVGPMRVSTVFLGIDHRFGGGEPLLWETMTFGAPDGEPMNRYSSRALAEAGHAEAVETAKKILEETQA